MNGTWNRELLAIVVTVLAVCIGGWALLVEPMATKLSRLEATITEAEAKGPQFTESIVKTMADQLQGVRGRMTRIAARNGLAADSARLYTTIKAMAADRNVTLRSHNLGDIRFINADDSEAAMPLNVEVSGRYVDVATFVQDVLELDGFIRLDTISLSPITQNEESVISAVIALETLSFAIPDVLTAIQGDAAGDT